MTSLKFFILLIFSFFNIIYSIEDGITIQINEDLCNEIKWRLIPELIQKYKNITFPDMSSSSNHFTIIHPVLSIHDVDINTITAKFFQPNVVNFKIGKIIADAKFDLNAKIAMINETFHVNVSISELSLNFNVSITTVESKPSGQNSTGKFLPVVYISGLVYQLEYDFQFSGVYVQAIITALKKLLKLYINTEINSAIEQLLGKNEAYMRNYMSQYPTCLSISNGSYIWDFSLLSNPEIINQTLGIAIQGLILGEAKEECLVLDSNSTSQVNLTKLSFASIQPQYSQNIPKNIQIDISQQVINTGLLTFYSSGIFRFSKTTDDFSHMINLQLRNTSILIDTTSLDLLFTGMSDVYGKDKKVKIDLQFLNHPPSFTIDNTKIFGEASLEIGISVETRINTNDLNEIYYEPAFLFQTEISFSAFIELLPEGKLVIEMLNIGMENSQLLNSTLPYAKVEYLQEIIAFGDAFLPMINKKLLKNIQVDLNRLIAKLIPEINIADSLIKLNEKKVQIWLSPTFTVKGG